MCATTAGCVLLRNRLRIRADGHQRSVPPIQHLTNLYCSLLHCTETLPEKLIHPFSYLYNEGAGGAWSLPQVTSGTGTPRQADSESQTEKLLLKTIFQPSNIMQSVLEICVEFCPDCQVIFNFNFNFLLPLEQKCALWGHSGLGTDTWSLLTAEMLMHERWVKNTDMMNYFKLNYRNWKDRWKTAWNVLNIMDFELCTLTTQTRSSCTGKDGQSRWR